MKKIILVLVLLKLFSVSAIAQQSYCLQVQKVSETIDKLTVIFILSSSSTTEFDGDASFFITGADGISGLAVVGGSATGSIRIGNGKSYPVANTSFNPAGTYTFDKVDLTKLATFIVNDNAEDGIGVLNTSVSPAKWIPAGCTINRLAFEAGIILPVDLISFTATKKEQTSQLKWETVSEKDLLGYMIERSTDGKNYHIIDYVQAKAKSQTERVSYEVIDTKPEIGINYYRLLTREKGANSTYSKVVSVDFGSGLKSKTYPNPFTSELSIEIDIELNIKGDVLIDLFDMAGKRVLSKKVVMEGRKLVFNLPTDNLVAGSYMIRIISGDKTWQHKISKQ